MALMQDAPSFYEQETRIEQRFQQKQEELDCYYASKREELRTSIGQIRAKLKQDLAAGVIDEQEANEQRSLINEKKRTDLTLWFRYELNVLEEMYQEKQDVLDLMLGAAKISAYLHKAEKDELVLLKKNDQQNLVLLNEERVFEQENAKLRQQLDNGVITAAEHHQRKLSLEKEHEMRKLTLEKEHEIRKLSLKKEHEMRKLKWQLDNRILNAKQYEDAVATALVLYNAGLMENVLVADRRLLSNTESNALFQRTPEVSAPSQPHSDIREFIESLRELSVGEDDDVLSLPEGVDMEGSAALAFLRGKLFIRECYRKLRDMILSTVAANPTEDNKVTCFIVHGNPGIGKSLFSYFMLYTLVKLEKTIIWEPWNTGLRVCITKDSIEFGGCRGFHGLLQDRSSWYIVDGKSPPHVSALTLRVCSLKRGDWYQSSNMGASVFCMPVWTWDELKKAHGLGLGLARGSRCNGEVALETVEKLFDIWGGIPARVFKHGDDDDSTRSLETAIAQAQLDDLLMFSSEGAKADNLDHNLLHVTVDPKEAAEDGREYKHGYRQLILASAYIRDRVTAKLVHAEREHLMGFLSWTEFTPTHATVRQHLFEGYAHTLLSEGGTFRVRRLGEGGVQENDPRSDVSVIQLNKTRVNLFKELKEVTSESGVYWQSKDLRSEAINALMLPNMLLKMTVSQDDPIPTKVLEDVVETLHATHAQRNVSERPSGKRRKQVGDDVGVLRLYYAVPERMFESYLKPVDTTPCGEQHIGGAPVAQFALEVCLKR